MNQAPAQVIGTTFIIRLKTGEERYHHFFEVMRGETAHRALDPLLDEMDGGYIASPVLIIRHEDGKFSREEIRIFSPEECD